MTENVSKNGKTEIKPKLAMNLNTIYFTSITQKAHRTNERVLEGAYVGMLWSDVMEETGVPGENHRYCPGDHNPATCWHRKSIPGRSGDRRGFYLCAIQEFDQ